MLRIMFVVAGLLAAQGCLAQVPDAPAPSSAQVDGLAERCWELLRMDDLAPVIRDEALAEAAIIQDTMFERGGDGRWIQIVGKIHETGRIEALLRDALSKALGEAPLAQTQAGLDFYDTLPGRNAIALESAARRSMLDKSVEDQAKADFASAAGRGDHRAGQITRMIAEADLADPNVAGGLNAAYAFAKGVQTGGGYTMPMTDAQLVADVWAQEAVIRADVRSWLEAFLYLAYSPLSDEEMEHYIEYSTSPEGQALYQAVVAAFNDLYSQLAGEMGYAFAGQLRGQAL